MWTPPKLQRCSWALSHPLLAGRSCGVPQDVLSPSGVSSWCPPCARGRSVLQGLQGWVQHAHLTPCSSRVTPVLPADTVFRDFHRSWWSRRRQSRQQRWFKNKINDHWGMNKHCKFLRCYFYLLVSNYSCWWEDWPLAPLCLSWCCGASSLCSELCFVMRNQPSCSLCTFYFKLKGCSLK